MFATLIICRLFCVPISLDGGPLHLPIIQAANTIIPDKETMQLYLIKDTINTTTPVITHSEYNSTFLYIIFSTESSVAFVTRFTWDFSSLSSLLVLQCWHIVWFLFGFVFFVIVIVLLTVICDFSSVQTSPGSSPHSFRWNMFLLF